MNRDENRGGSRGMNRKERVIQRLQELGADGPKRSLGQNFLISDQVIEKILKVVQSAPAASLVEVGPGLGALTDDLIALNQPLILIELDRRFAEAWRGRGLPQTTVIEGDALKLDWRAFGIPENSLFVSNLPYQISSSLVIERSLEPAGINRMILMFQKEVAQRIAAGAASKEYGLLTVIAQAFWETSTVCEAGPRDFFPSPNVASRVLHFKKREAQWLNTPGVTRGHFLSFAKAAFSHRRKLLTRNLLGGFFSGPKDVLPLLEQIFASQGLLATARAEELDPEAFIRLYLAVTHARSSNESKLS